jgi:hypothetical protein
MGTPTREWPWLHDGYQTVRLTVGDDILPPTRDQVISAVEAAVKSATNVAGIEQGVGSFPSPYLPLRFEVKSPTPEHLDVEVHVKRR